MENGSTQTEKFNDLFPAISKIISEVRFSDALLIIEAKLTTPGLGSDEEAWLHSNHVMCVVGCAAVALGEGKKLGSASQNEQAHAMFKKAISIIEPHLDALNLDKILADQMTTEMRSMVKHCKLDQLAQIQKDRSDIIEAVDAMLPDSMGRRALKVLLDAYFQIGLIERSERSNEIGGDLSYLQDLIKDGQYEKALQKVEMERLRNGSDANLQEHLDWVEKAARSITICDKYKSGNKHFDLQNFDLGLAAYRELVEVIKGKYALFKLNEEALPKIVKDFKDKLRSGAIASYEDSLVFRNSYMEPLKVHFGEGTDWQTITMVLDAHLAIAFYTKLKSVNPKLLQKKKKSSFFRTWLWLWSFGLIKR